MDGASDLQSNYSRLLMDYNNFMDRRVTMKSISSASKKQERSSKGKRKLMREGVPRLTFQSMNELPIENYHKGDISKMDTTGGLNRQWDKAYQTAMQPGMDTSRFKMAESNNGEQELEVLVNQSSLGDVTSGYHKMTNYFSLEGELRKQVTPKPKGQSPLVTLGADAMNTSNSGSPLLTMASQ